MTLAIINEGRISALSAFHLWTILAKGEIWMPICPVCSKPKHPAILYYQHWLSASKNPNEYRYLTYWCERGNHFLVLQRQQTANPNLPTAIRCLVLTPTGRASKVAVSRRFGKTKTSMSRLKVIRWTVQAVVRDWVTFQNFKLKEKLHGYVWSVLWLYKSRRKPHQEHCKNSSKLCGGLHCIKERGNWHIYLCQQKVWDHMHITHTPMALAHADFSKPRPSILKWFWICNKWPFQSYTSMWKKHV